MRSAASVAKSQFLRLLWGKAVKVHSILIIYESRVCAPSVHQR
jgi:hypothetical protein